MKATVVGPLGFNTFDLAAAIFIQPFKTLTTVKFSTDYACICALKLFRKKQAKFYGMKNRI